MSQMYRKRRGLLRREGNYSTFYKLIPNFSEKVRELGYAPNKKNCTLGNSKFDHTSNFMTFSKKISVDPRLLDFLKSPGKVLSIEISPYKGLQGLIFHVYLRIFLRA